MNIKRRLFILPGDNTNEKINYSNIMLDTNRENSDKKYASQKMSYKKNYRSSCLLTPNIKLQENMADLNSGIKQEYHRKVPVSWI